MALLIFHSSCIGYVLSLARMGLFHGTFKLLPNIIDVIVLEITISPEMEKEKNSHYFTIR